MMINKMVGGGRVDNYGPLMIKREFTMIKKTMVLMRTLRKEQKQ